MNKLKQLISSIQGGMLALLALFALSACTILPVAQVNEKRLEPSTTIVAALDSSKMEPIVQDVTLLEPVPVLAEVKVVDSASLKCLAQTMYFEAKGEPERGQIAVAYVVLNRTKDPRFPDTVCGVVKQTTKTKVGMSCQFHWYCDGKADVIKDQKSYDKIVEVARRVLLDETVNPVGKSLFFHAVYVKPQKKRYAYRQKIANHIFYT